MSDCYTYPPNAQKPASKLQQVSALHGILDHISDSVAIDEKNIALLLHAFDLNPDSEDWTTDAPATPPYTSPPRTPYRRTKLSNTPSPDSVPRSRHPFLLTPIRKEHFPSLDPLILRELLRSPSDYEPLPNVYLKNTPDYKRDLNLKQTPEIRVSMASIDSLHSPPPSPSPAPLPASPDYLMLPSVTSQLGGKGDSEFQSSLVAIVESPTRQQPRSLNRDISSQAIKGFHLVLDEIEGRITRPPCKPSSSDKGSDLAATEARLSPSPVITQTTQPTYRSTGPHIGVLHREFATILTDKALIEEAGSEMLRALADRMQHLAEKRRALVAAVTSPH